MRIRAIPLAALAILGVGVQPGWAKPGNKTCLYGIPKFVTPITFQRVSCVQFPNSDPKCGQSVEYDLVSAKDGTVQRVTLGPDNPVTEARFFVIISFDGSFKSGIQEKTAELETRYTDEAGCAGATIYRFIKTGNDLNIVEGCPTGYKCLP